MYSKGVVKIGCPMRGRDGLYILVGNVLIVLFNYIPAPQSYDYSEHGLGRLLAQIHDVTARVTVATPAEDFTCALPPRFDERFEGTLNSTSTDPVIETLQTVLRAHETEIRHYLAEFLRLGALCREQRWQGVITHGDAPGNVLVKSFEDIYLIDWDEILLAPPERDLWIMDHSQAFLDGYRSGRPDHVASASMRGYYIYKYFFRSMTFYFSEIFGDFEREYRLSHVRQLDDDLLAGWMLPKLGEINAS
jgi:hypothetical protein